MDWGELKKQIVSVTVSKPEQQGKGRKKFTDFLVTALFDNGAEALSRRTFEDFEWLYNRLVHDYLGIIVPVLPERKPASAADKFSEAFVNDCQAVLQRFIQRVIAHPDLLQASNLVKFLTANPADWKTIKEQVYEKEETVSADGSLHSNATSDSVLFIDAEAAAAPPEVSQKKPGMMGRWWAGRAERKALNNPKYPLEENPQETKKFNEIEDYCDHLYECIMVIEENAKVLTAAYQTQAERLQTMGSAFQQLWGEHELSNTSASVMYQTVGDSWGALHNHVEGQHSFGVAFFDTPMEELRLDVMALKRALKKRKKVVYDYTVKVKESRSLQNQMDKLKKHPDLSAIAEKYYKVEHYLKAKDLEVAETKQLTETMGLRLTRDIERFRIEFHHRMQEVLHNYHTAQARYLSGQSQLFLDAVPAITNMKSGRTNLPKSSPTKVNTPGLKISTSTSGTSVTIDSPAAAEHYVGQVSLPPPATKSPPPQPPAVATPSPEKPSIVPPSPEKQSVPVPNFDDDDDGAFSGSGFMGGISGDQTPNGDATSAPPPAAAPPPLPPLPHAEPPLPPPSPTKEAPPVEAPLPPPSTPQEESSSSSPPKASPTEEPPLPTPSPEKESELVHENDSVSSSDS
mmetsp:Transcript_24352/g.59626  ORF Transcript_24352/g.59626 Transcript_24352/m.59626 type:complete len:628 (+) Transcript_24352:133-2016(+)